MKFGIITGQKVKFRNIVIVTFLATHKLSHTLLDFSQSLNVVIASHWLVGNALFSI